MIVTMKRVLSLMLAAALVFGMLPPAAARAETTGLCEHLAEHQEGCHFTPSDPGDPCACQDTDEDGELDHQENCGYRAPVAGVDCTCVCQACLDAATPAPASEPAPTDPPKPVYTEADCHCEALCGDVRDPDCLWCNSGDVVCNYKEPAPVYTAENCDCSSLCGETRDADCLWCTSGDVTCAYVAPETQPQKSQTVVELEATIAVLMEDYGKVDPNNQDSINAYGKRINAAYALMENLSAEDRASLDAEKATFLEEVWKTFQTMPTVDHTCTLHSEITDWQSVTGSAITTPGNYYLTADATIDSISEGVVLCLNGYTMTASSGTTASLAGEICNCGTQGGISASSQVAGTLTLNNVELKKPLTYSSGSLTLKGDIVANSQYYDNNSGYIAVHNTTPNSTPVIDIKDLKSTTPVKIYYSQAPTQSTLFFDNVTKDGYASIAPAFMGEGSADNLRVYYRDIDANGVGKAYVDVKRTITLMDGITVTFEPEKVGENGKPYSGSAPAYCGDEVEFSNFPSGTASLDVDGEIISATSGTVTYTMPDKDITVKAVASEGHNCGLSEYADVEDWIALTGDVSGLELAAGKHYYLQNDITCSYINAQNLANVDFAVLCLNGHTLTVSGTIYRGTYVDCKGTGKILGSGSQIRLSSGMPTFKNVTIDAQLYPVGSSSGDITVQGGKFINSKGDYAILCTDGDTDLYFSGKVIVEGGGLYFTSASKQNFNLAEDSSILLILGQGAKLYAPNQAQYFIHPDADEGWVYINDAGGYVVARQEKMISLPEGVTAKVNDVEKSTAVQNDKVTLSTEIPNATFVVKTATGAAVSLTGGNTFTMPNANVVVELIISYNLYLGNLTATIDGTPGKIGTVLVPAGTQVQITTALESNQKLTATKADGTTVTITDNAFTMPESEATVTLVHWHTSRDYANFYPFTGTVSPDYGADDTGHVWYYLESDYTGNLVIPDVAPNKDNEVVWLCLNNQTVKGITVESGVQVNLLDCGDRGRVTGDVEVYGTLDFYGGDSGDSEGTDALTRVIMRDNSSATFQRYETPDSPVHVLMAGENVYVNSYGKVELYYKESVLLAAADDKGWNVTTEGLTPEKLEGDEDYYSQLKAVEPIYYYMGTAVGSIGAGETIPAEVILNYSPMYKIDGLPEGVTASANMKYEMPWGDYEFVLKDGDAYYAAINPDPNYKIILSGFDPDVEPVFNGVTTEVTREVEEDGTVSYSFTMPLNDVTVSLTHTHNCSIHTDPGIVWQPVNNSLYPVNGTNYPLISDTGYYFLTEDTNLKNLGENVVLCLNGHNMVLEDNFVYMTGTVCNCSTTQGSVVKEGGYQNNLNAYEARNIVFDTYVWTMANYTQVFTDVTFQKRITLLDSSGLKLSGKIVTEGLDYNSTDDGHIHVPNSSPTTTKIINLDGLADDSKVHFLYNIPFTQTTKLFQPAAASLLENNCIEVAFMESPTNRYKLYHVEEENAIYLAILRTITLPEGVSAKVNDGETQSGTVTAFPDDTITITTLPGGTMPVIKDADGNTITPSKVTDDEGNTTYSFPMPDGNVTITLTHDCGIHTTITDWKVTDGSSLLATGHYYFTADATNSSPQWLPTTYDAVYCLNGHNWGGLTTMGLVAHATGTLVVCNCGAAATMTNLTMSNAGVTIDGGTNGITITNSIDFNGNGSLTLEGKVTATYTAGDGTVSGADLTEGSKITIKEPTSYTEPIKLTDGAANLNYFHVEIDEGEDENKDYEIFANADDGGSLYLREIFKEPIYYITIPASITLNENQAGTALTNTLDFTVTQWQNMATWKVTAAYGGPSVPVLTHSQGAQYGQLPLTLTFGGVAIDLDETGDYDVFHTFTTNDDISVDVSAEILNDAYVGEYKGTLNFTFHCVSTTAE